MRPLAPRAFLGVLLLHPVLSRAFTLASQADELKPAEAPPREQLEPRAQDPKADAALAAPPRGAPTFIEARDHRERKDGTPSLRESVPSILMASLAGLTTTFGAFIIFAMPQGPPPWAMAFTLSLAAGVMVTVASELVWGKKGRSLWPWLLFVAGALITWLLSYLATSLQQQTEGEEKEPKQRSMWRLAVVLFVSLTLHNFPEGMAVAVSALQSSQLGLTICIGIACHNIPEGITIAVTTYEATKCRWKALLMTFLSGIAEPIGAISAVLVFRRFLTEQVVECLVAAVAGVMLYISVAELLPEALSTRRWLCGALGFVTGVVVIVITSVVIDRSFG